MHDRNSLEQNQYVVSAPASGQDVRAAESSDSRTATERCSHKLFGAVGNMVELGKESVSTENRALSKPPRNMQADLWVVEHVASRYDIPYAVVEELLQAVLSGSNDEELPGWLTARVMLRVLYHELVENFSGISSLSKVIEHVQTLKSISADPFLPAHCQAALCPPDSAIADLKTCVVLCELLNDEVVYRFEGSQVFRRVLEVVEKQFPTHCSNLSEEERQRGWQIRADLSSPEALTSAPDRLQTVQARLLLSLRQYHDTAKSTLGRTTLEFAQEEIENCPTLLSTKVK